MTMNFRKGERGLEVCGDGPRQTVPLDLHFGSAGRHRWDHLAGSHPLRRSGSD